MIIKALFELLMPKITLPFFDKLFRRLFPALEMQYSGVTSYDTFLENSDGDQLLYVLEVEVHRDDNLG